jgi:hypothetical protein
MLHFLALNFFFILFFFSIVANASPNPTAKAIHENPRTPAPAPAPHKQKKRVTWRFQKFKDTKRFPAMIEKLAGRDSGTGLGYGKKRPGLPLRSRSDFHWFF